VVPQTFDDAEKHGAHQMEVYYPRVVISDRYGSSPKIISCVKDDDLIHTVQLINICADNTYLALACALLVGFSAF
jgi:hypothetical protein